MKRLIKHWGKNSEEAFGVSGRIGDLGELLVEKAFLNKGHDVKHNQSIKKQKAGFDLEVKIKNKKLSFDLKTNMTKFDAIAIEIDDDGWLFNDYKKTEYIYHLSIHKENYGNVAFYKRKDMQKHIGGAPERYRIYTDDNGKSYVYVLRRYMLDFITWTHLDNL